MLFLHSTSGKLHVALSFLLPLCVFVFVTFSNFFRFFVFSQIFFYLFGFFYGLSYLLDFVCPSVHVRVCICIFLFICLRKGLKDYYFFGIFYIALCVASGVQTKWKTYCVIVVVSGVCIYFVEMIFNGVWTNVAMWRNVKENWWKFCVN